MGDPTHLEKMGRELKCPICLSLLNSAVSLTCNHVFCNSCIMKSMKSGSACPVCKVPYRRREVRAAPHMDNLVSIYKSMEIASGFNIFVTQNSPPLTKLSDEHKQVGGNTNCGRDDIDWICEDTLGEQSILSKQEDSRKLNKSHMELSAPITSKPSFPTKKRVQVPQCSVSHSLAQPEKLQTGSRENKKGDFKNDLSVSRKNPIVNEKGEPTLSPFFWLRDEDGEKSSQHTDVDQLLDITPPNVPTFSDIKDSDDENASASYPKGTACGKSNVADFCDSEMFEWTQRACSPEIFSSPAKIQAENTTEMNGIQEGKSEAPPLSANANDEHSDESKKCVNTKPGMGVSEDVLVNRSPAIVKSARNQIGRNISNKRGRTAKDATLRKCARKNADKDLEVTVAAKRVSGKTMEKELEGKEFFLTSKEIEKWNKKDGGLKGEDVSSVSVRETLDMDDENTATDQLPISLDKKQGCSDLKRKENGSGKISPECKEQKLDSIEINMINEVFSNQNHMDNDESSHVYLLSVPLVEDKKISDINGKPSKQGEEVKSALSSEDYQEFKCKKNMEVSLDGILEDGLVNDHQEGPGIVFAEEAHSTENINNNSAKATESAEKVQASLNTGSLDNSATLGEHCKENDMAMLKLKLNYNIQCAFCLSSEDSEASGEMIHYYNGIPVTADYNGGSRVIHSHRNCAEWAPNVYFEDDNAINLEAELARSRRIKCCCCGLKGAALGCYEKSCRKSFHVPCANLIRQCRWDTENFVILCPLHASYKLPNESTRSQERRKKKCISKGQAPRQYNQHTFKHDINKHESWKSCVTHEKLVLCCSALTIGEKEIVSEFESLSGVTALKNWDLSVTHVIASTDENGACRRTLKVLMGILKGKWIVNIEWVKACIKAMKLVEEMQYEIAADIHGIKDGPRNGRLRLLNKQPNIFEGFKFYFLGDFIPSYKGYIQDLLIAGGGTILHRKPISGAQGNLLLDSSRSPTFIIYSLEMPDKCDPSKKNMILNRRWSNAEALASSTGAKAVSNKWVLNSIAACKLLAH
ncbi:unnamed protein product [Dovyalis caffra]|uniref:Uncharacterized protein n=1 Tax=Dovyalis caffra TaxID=77055 RepID=A0AAV1SIE1_9ROSI|nr:unnamed protein product [Dovyalis caffra]